MSSPGAVACLALMAGVSSCLAVDCSYFTLMEHLNLMSKNATLVNIRPVKNWTTSTFVQLDFGLSGILEVDAKSQTFTFHSWMTMGWMNDFISWNPADFCGMFYLNVPREMLWFPDVVLTEDVSSNSKTKRPYLVVYSSGFVMTTKIQRWTTTCQMNLMKFPFDTQTCSLTFVPLPWLGSGITLGHFSNSSQLTQLSARSMVTRGEWTLKDISIAKSDDDNQTLTYQITIQRRPMLYVINFILPLFYFLLLDMASFFIGEAVGEKLNFKVTILLSISVLLLILKDMLPSTDDQLPLIALYCIVIFSLVGLSLLETMLVSFLLDLDSRVDGDAPGSTCAETRAEAGCQTEHNGESEQDAEVPQKERLDLEWQSDPGLLKLILKELQAVRQDCCSTVSVKQDNRRPGYYKRVARFIDDLFFALYVVSNILFLVCINCLWVIV